MSKGQAETEIAVARRLEETGRPESPNQISLDELRRWAVAYLDEYDEELTRFPDFAGQTHWNLWMRDVQLEDALFVVLVFRADEMEFICGTGDAFQVKSFAEREFPDNPDDLVPVMAARFSVPVGGLLLKREDVERWLGRGW
ncbi:MAG: hypothetical protein RIC55_26475 [Pirellulaceae bacterium]